jgi:Secretion system C-terminal sorting domain/Putative carbohydrate metabolism domain
MKRIYTLISLFLISAHSLFSQQTPNGGFESWTTVPASPPAPAYDNPNSWNTLNSLTSGAGAITCYKVTAGADVHSGSAAIKLITRTVGGPGGQVANGLLTTGTIHPSTSSVGGGVSYTLRPDSIIGWYKYAPANSSDNGFFEIQLLGAGGDTDTIGYAKFKTPTTAVSSYTRFALKINYRDTTSQIVKSLWILSSSASNFVHFQNSTMFADDVQLGSDAWLLTGINEIAAIDLTVGPNPASESLTVKNPASVKAFFLLYDVTGRVAQQEKIAGTYTSIDVADLPSGLYIYSITDENGLVIKTGKVFIQK